MEAANKTLFTIIGKVRVVMKYCGRFMEDDILVVKEDTLLLIEWYKCIDLGILHKNYLHAPLEVQKVNKPVKDDLLYEKVASQMRRMVHRAAVLCEELSRSLTDPHKEWIKRAAAQDPEYRCLVKYIRERFPISFPDVDPAVQPYFIMRRGFT